MTGGLHPVVVLASAGRPGLLSEVLEDVLGQTLDIDVVVSVPDSASLPSSVPDGVKVVHASGLAAQRNAGVEAIEDRDAIVFFFDDDSVVSEDYVQRALEVFAGDSEVVGLTGRVLLDGATGEAVDRETADTAIAAAGSRTHRTHHWEQLYGCNFAYRRAAAPTELFDARLPLYSWLEDHDFARRLLRHGRIVKADDCVIVHRGVKSGGRAAHARLGYSQMMNPLYLHRKGSFPLWLTIKEILPRCGKNLILSLGGPEASWRRQRLRGNLAALRDAMTGSFEPERMLRY